MWLSSACSRVWYHLMKREALGRRDFVKDIFVVTTSLSVLFRPEEAHATRAVGRFFFIKIVFPSITGRCDSISDLTPACFCWYRFRFIFHIVQVQPKQNAVLLVTAQKKWNQTARQVGHGVPKIDGENNKSDL